MNKQDIFPLYVGKCKVLVTQTVTSSPYNKYIADFVGIEKETIIHKNQKGTSSKTVRWYWYNHTNIKHCQLILKRISDMSEGDMREITAITEDNGLKMGEQDYCVGADTFWLIQNGYALSDDWFANGIAVEEKTK